MLKRRTRILYGIMGLTILAVAVVDWRDVLDWPSEAAIFWLLEIPAGAACLYAAVTGRWMRVSGPATPASN